MLNKKRAFTLIELLVVIAIIGILTTIAVVALNNARAKARNAKRVADVKQIQTALELFFNDKNRYPTAEEFASGSIYSTSTNGTTTYMAAIPQAPTPPDGNCDTSSNTYSYAPVSGSGDYGISFCVGGNVAQISGGYTCASPNGLASGNCCETIWQPTIDGELYQTKQIGSQCWLAQNINVGSRVSLCVAGDCSGADCQDGCTTRGTTERNQADASGENFEKFCYNDDENSCTTYGGLYQWPTAMALPSNCLTSYFTDNLDGTFTGLSGNCTGYIIAAKHQGICPEGWHIPTDADWSTLESGQSTPPVNTNCSPTRVDWGCSPASINLGAGGSTGFNGALAGVSGSGYGFGQQGSYVGFWSTLPINNDSWFRLFSGGGTIYRGSGYFRTKGFSVRCIKD